jgi:hypothetical protein
MSVRFATAFAFLALAATDAQAVYYVWQGDVVVTSASGPCGAATSERARIATGTVLRSVLRPKSLGTNGTDTRITFLHDSQATWLGVFARGVMPNGTMAAWGSNHSGVIRANVGGTYTGLTQVPVSPTTTTPSITLAGTLNNFMFISGCTVTFRGGYVRRPD